MSLHKTRLDSFLRVVELDEDAAAVAHAAVSRELLLAHARSEDLRRELRRDGRARGPSSEWMVLEMERQRLVEALKVSELNIARITRLEQEKLRALTAAHQKAESIRNAIDRLRGEQVRELSRRESKETDELAIARHRRADRLVG
jgi:flagellar biosynthesis chaperone FliJ